MQKGFESESPLSQFKQKTIKNEVYKKKSDPKLELFRGLWYKDDPYYATIN